MTEEQAELEAVRVELDELMPMRRDRSLPVIELARYEQLIEREAQLLGRLCPSARLRRSAVVSPMQAKQWTVRQRQG